ncbi:histone acetylation protein-domain-containing protein [Hypomontagnella monticulosa]|nr:histone acetylation protein-domain-containing protein [Hypomontagnella monticulosa]
MSSPSEAREGDHANIHPLVAELAKVLPKGLKFTAFHLSTPPTTTEPLCHPPAYNPAPDPKVSDDAATKSKDRRRSKPLKTYCEKHFLAISINAGKEGTQGDSDRQVLVLGLEIYIYTTSFSTIIFVSKADSTGYLTLLGLPQGSPSPIREVTACFLAFLVANRRRPTKQLVVNLFARAQSQYLFPGSVKNSSKHVLDDRGLVKWWCRVLNSLLEGGDYTDMRKSWGGIRGYLVVPGLDNYETRAFLPRTSLATTNWTFSHPLETISPYTKNPGTYGDDIHPRCLIPMYPDDPKARFVQELEESTPEKAKLVTGWKSPKTLDQFWEMMAFRQECSSGRLTGFIWVVFNFKRQDAANPVSSGTTLATAIPTPDASPSAPANSEQNPNISRASPMVLRPKAAKSKSKKFGRKLKGKKKLTGPIIMRRPQIKTHQRANFPQEIHTPYYFWPESGRGQVVLNDNGYKRAIELLLHLEFGTLEQAIASTARWTNEVNMGEKWALEIVGERATTVAVASSSGSGAVNNLTGMVRRKRGSDDQPQDGSVSSAPVNTLGEGLVRKKAKLDAGTPAGPSDQSFPAPNSNLPINILGAGLVRRKPKAS